MPDELLAEREVMGYPNTRVALHIDFSRNRARVIVTDSRGEHVLHKGNRKDAKDAYFHPFARGYVVPCVEVEEYDDGA